MLTIHKFPFEFDSIVTIKMPAFAEILSVDMQGRVPCIWALVDTDFQLVDHSFRIFGTGHDIPREHYSKEQFVSTFQDGPYVWHLFASKELTPS